jgi:tetratricopeptide (TPR) repeat protein
MAQAMLDLSRPEEALEALTDISCHVCRSYSQYRQSQNTFGKDQIIGCAADCPNFDHANSSYAGSVDKEFWLTLDATELAIEAHLAAAQLTLTAAEMNVETACSHWKQAIKMASELGAEYSDNTQRQIVNATLGRSAALQRDRRLDEAIALLERSQHICQVRHRQEIRSQLGEVLTNRGIKAGNNEPPNWSAAAKDLRRAVDLNAHAVRARINLCIVLNSWAGQELDQDNEHMAIKLLEEVVERVNKAGSAGANHPNLQRELADANEALSMIYNRRGVRLANEKDWTSAIRALDSAVKLAPHAELVQQNLKQIYRNYAFDFLERGQPSDCIQVLRTALSRFPNDPILQTDLVEILALLKEVERRRY